MAEAQKQLNFIYLSIYKFLILKEIFLKKETGKIYVLIATPLDFINISFAYIYKFKKIL